MAWRDFQRMLADVRARLGRIAGSGAEQTPTAGRRSPRRRALALAVIVGLLAIGAVGYAIGSSQVRDVDSAYQAGMSEGERRGTALGARRGYEDAFRLARERAYDAAYREAYTTAYGEAFERADLAAPRTVKVAGP